MGERVSRRYKLFPGSFSEEVSRGRREWSVCKALLPLSAAFDDPMALVQYAILLVRIAISI